MQQLQFARCLGHQQAHLPVAAVKAQSDGLAIFGAQAAMRAQDQKLGIKQPRRLPTHAGILRQAEEVARGLRQQHLGRQRQSAFRAAGMRGYIKQFAAFGFKHRREGDVCDGRALSL